MRLISIFAVVLIHTTTRELEVTHYDLINNQISLFLNQAARFAVPLFFLISGFVLELSYRENENYFNYLKRRLSKILLPYLIWSLIYYFFIYTNHSEDLIHALIDGSSSYQLYFIPSLFIFYLIFPILHKIKLKKYILIVLFVIQILILNYVYKYFTFPLPYPIAVAVFNFFVFILGIYLVRNINDFKKILNKIWVLLIPVTIYLAYFIFKEGFNRYYQTWNVAAFYIQFRPSILIYTIFVFGILYFIFSKIKINFLSELSRLSFFVFFIHVIILENVWKYLSPKNDLVFFGIVSIISFSVAYLIHRFLPIASKCLG